METGLQDIDTDLEIRHLMQVTAAWTLTLNKTTALIPVTSCSEQEAAKVTVKVALSPPFLHLFIPYQAVTPGKAVFVLGRTRCFSARSKHTPTCGRKLWVTVIPSLLNTPDQHTQIRVRSFWALLTARK